MTKITYAAFVIKYYAETSAPTPRKIAGETPDQKKAIRRLQIHIFLITVSAIVTTVLLTLHVGNPIENAFLPIGPSALQEFTDYLKKL